MQVNSVRATSSNRKGKKADDFYNEIKRFLKYQDKETLLP